MAKRARSLNDKALKKREIKEAAKEFILRDPMQLPSVSQIALALNMTKGSLYKHFPGKERIFFEILKDELEKWFALAHEKVHSQEAFTKFLTAVFDPFLENKLLLRLSFTGQGGSLPFSPDGIASDYKNFLANEIETLAEKMAERHSISKRLVARNLSQSFSVMQGAFATASIFGEDVKLRAGAMLTKIWQY